MSLRHTSPGRLLRGLGLAVIALSGATWPARLDAQLPDIRGTVTDSVSRAPVAGAVIMLLDNTGTMLARTMASERGAYRLLRLPEATELRVVRLGFAPALVPLRVAVGRAEGGYLLDVRLTALARALDEVAVAAPVARGCETRSDHIRSLALLEAARAGVLSTVVANEKDPPRLTMLRFERILDDEGIEVVSQSVRVDSSPAAATSFNAVHSAADFLANGFRSGRAGDYVYYSPDAGVLLDERFPQGYCFDVVPSDTVHPTHVGLHFAPAMRRRGRVDIDGTLWIDTARRSLSELTFRYLGIDAVSEGLGAGGHIGFRSLPSGVTFIDRWHMRLISSPSDAAPGERQAATYQVRDVGGELAEARWSDGRVWSAPLATVHLTAVGDGNRPAPHARLRLLGTEYRTVANADGRASIPNVLPGPYTIGIDDPLLRTLGLSLPTSRSFTAVRGASFIVRVPVDGPIALARTVCGRNDAPRPNESWVIGRIVDEYGRPVEAARWRVFEGEDGQWKSRSDPRPTDSDGLFAFCRGVRRGRTIEVTASVRGRETVRRRQILDAPLVAMAITLPAAERTRPPHAVVVGSLTVTGVVTDSISGVPQADARVRLVGTPFEGATDELGRFVIGGVSTGRYVMEVGTAALDAFGLVSRRSLDLHDSLPPLTLPVPNLAAARTTVCRAQGGSGSSLIVGRLSVPDGNLAAISGYRIVAAWQGPHIDGTGMRDGMAMSVSDSTGGFVRVSPDPNSGTFRICDAPVGRPLIISAEADRMSGGSASGMLTLPAPDALARMDLVLDSDMAAPTVWSGTIVADSGAHPVSGSDVVLANLGVTLQTNPRGQFRIRGLPAGQHLASVRVPGFEPWLGTVRIAPGQAIEQQIVLVRTGRPDVTHTSAGRVR